MIQLASDITVHLESPFALSHRLTQAAISGWIITGNLYETSSEALWNGELAQNVRLGLLGKGEINPVCARCPYTGFNLERYTRYL